MNSVLAWRVRQVRGKQDPERFLVEFLPLKEPTSSSSGLGWEGDGVERDEAHAREHAATVGVSVGAFRAAIGRARATFGRP